MSHVDQAELEETERQEAREGKQHESSHDVPAQTLEEQNKHLAQELHVTEEHLEHLTESIASEREHLAKVRADMGLAPSTEESPSILADLAEVAMETLLHTKEEEKVVEVNHAQDVVEAQSEKGKEILMDLIFEFCKKMPEKDLEHLVEFGLNASGKKISLPIIGDVTPDVAKIFVQAVKAGKHSFPMEMLRKSGVLDQIEKQLEKKAMDLVVDQLLAPKKDGALTQVVAGIAEGVVRAGIHELTSSDKKKTE